MSEKALLTEEEGRELVGMIDSTDGAILAVAARGERDAAKFDTLMRRIPVKQSTVVKMKKIAGLFAEEPGFDPKEAEMIAFFFETAFEFWRKSGAVQERLNDVTN